MSGLSWALVAIVAVRAGAASAAPSTPWPEFQHAYIEGYFAGDPVTAVNAGRHDYDGRLPDWTARGIAARVAWLDRERKLALRYRDAVLAPRQRFERDYLVARIDTDLFWLRVARAPFTNPANYLGALDPSVYLARPYAPLATRLRAYIGYLRAVPAATRAIRANLQTPMPRTFADRGQSGASGYAEFFRGDALRVFAEVDDPALQAELRAATGPAALAMQRLGEWFAKEQKRANDRFALGPARFAAMLAMTEGVTTPLARLEEIGRADLERNQTLLKAACDDYARGASLSDCMAKMSASKPEGSPVETARAQLDGLRQYIADHDLVSIPGEERALVDEAPSYQRWNSAYIDIAGPYDKGMPSTYYIAPPDPAWTEAEQAAYIPGKADLLFTSVHEVWPGHFLQFLHSNRSPFEFGQVFVGYAFAEGWAHYGEEMMWDAGLGDGSPEVHIGQLSNALLRNVRFLCAIGMHTRGMTVDQCAAMFREQGYQDSATARQQAARGSFDPAYLNYTLGKLMIRKLREDWTASRGGRAAWHAFHDRFLSYGGPPIPLVRREMMGSAAPDSLF